MNRFQEYIIEVEDQEWLTRIYYMMCNVFNEYDAKILFFFFFFFLQKYIVWCVWVL